jgi:hypothetical protein
MELAYITFSDCKDASEIRRNQSSNRGKGLTECGEEEMEKAKESRHKVQGRSKIEGTRSKKRHKWLTK